MLSTLGVLPTGLPSRVQAFAVENPALAVGIAVLGLLVLIGLFFLIRRLRRTPGQRFQRVLANVDEVTVLMHPNPDPDAMATALGTIHLAERVDVDTHLRYPGQIRHQENRAFRTVLGMDATSIDSKDELTGEVILVDHNEPRGFQGAGGVTPYAVVDHHPGAGTGQAHTDVRTEYGATATIIAEYAAEMGLEPASSENGTDEKWVENDLLPPPIATGLLFGILADTNHLTRGCSPSEFEASSYLYPGIDEDSLDRIANPAVEAEVLEMKAKAIMDRDLRAPYVISDVGSVSNVDAIPQAADELLSLEGVSAVVVFGDKEETIHLSGRSRDDRVHMGDALAAVAEDIPMSDAGGHARMGGGQISVPHMSGLREDSGMSRTDLKERIFETLAGEV